MKAKRAKKIDSITLTMDRNRLTHSVPKRHITAFTRSRYDTTLQYFDKYHELHLNSTIPLNYQTFKSFLVWVLKPIDKL
jgi:hypothetical protein